MIFLARRVQITSVHHQRTLRDRAVRATVHRLCHKIRCTIHQHLRITHHKLQVTAHKVQAIRPPALTIHQQGNYKCNQMHYNCSILANQFTKCF